MPDKKKKIYPKRGGKRRKPRVSKKIISPWPPLAAILLFFLCLVLPHIGRDLSATGAPIPHGSFRYGIDISHNNSGKIVWDSLRVMKDAKGRSTSSIKKAVEINPVSFIFIKATEGESMKDRRFKENWKKATEAGIKRGAYHFFRSSKDPAIQARNFIETVGELKQGDLAPVLDIETIHRGCGKDKLNEKALVWLHIVEKHYGKLPIVYTSANFASEILSKEITEEYPLWIAHYGVESPGISKWKFWQVSDKAAVYGIKGRVDLNVAPKSGRL